MEPGHEDREYVCLVDVFVICVSAMPQWSPVMKTGNTNSFYNKPRNSYSASMEPGHEDREYVTVALHDDGSDMPQWSPVMKTGNTSSQAGKIMEEATASMEPGHEDREYHPGRRLLAGHHAASMEPGHEDREYLGPRTATRPPE